MDEIGQARSRKFAESLRNSNWAIDAGAQDAQNAVGFWLYSYNLSSGPRVVGQTTLEGYRVMQAGEQLQELDGLEPADILGSALHAYDALPEQSRCAQESAVVIAAMSLYACSTRTWQSLPSLSTGTQLHFMIFDWLTSPNNRVFRPAAVVGGDVLTPETLADFAEQVATMHLAKYPNEIPL